MKHQAQSQSTSTSTIPTLKLAPVHKLAGLMLAIGVAAAAGSTILTSVPMWAQSEVAQPTAQAASIPKLIRYSGTLVDGRGWPITTPVSVTFAIYAQPSGDEQPALWQETQQISPNNRGSYVALLGQVSPAGVPVEIFKAGESQYLSVKVEGEPEQPRVLLVSVPYALKAADAATLGGLPASAYALAGTKSVAGAVFSPAMTPDTVTNVATTGGTSGRIPEFSGSTIVDSPVFVSGANVGIGTTTPTATLDVDGSTILDGAVTVDGTSAFNGALVLEPAGTATASVAFDSQTLKLVSSVFNPVTREAVNPRFEWQVEAKGNNTSTPSGKLDLLTSVSNSDATQTGFYFNADGTVNFAPGQTFPSVGTITGVTAGTALTGGGTTGNVTLNLDTTKVPLLGTANSFVGNQSITGSATANDISSSANSAGLIGNENAASGMVFGVTGNARSTTSGAAGVSGKESAATGLVYGVLGTANSSTSNAAGVQGVENATTGMVYGVNGTSASSGTNSAGVGGYAMAKTGSVAGVSGYAVSTTNGASGTGGYEGATTGAVYGVSGGTGSITNGAAGVFGEENAATGQVFGVSGTVYSSTTNGAAGVNGYEGAATGVVYGVNGGTNSSTSSASGVNGYDSAATGQVYGVSGSANSSTGGAAGVVGQESAASGQVFGVYGGTQSTAGIGVSGNASSATGQTYGVAGNANSTGTNSAGVYGLETATTGMVHGVQGTSISTTSNAAGVSGFEGAATGVVYGVTGGTNSSTQSAAGVNGFEGSSTGIVYGVNGSATSSTNFAAGVSGYESATTGLVYGVYGGTASANGVGVQGQARSTTGYGTGVAGVSESTSGGPGVSGTTDATSGSGVGVAGFAPDTTGLNFGVAGTAGKNGVGVQGGSPHIAVAGFSQDCSSSPCTIASGTAGQFATGTGGLILQGLGGASLSSLNQVFSIDASGNGYFAGNLSVTGKLSKGSGSFKIDDPLDPEHKFLSHSFVESPDMMDVYNGNITTDKRGVATVELPKYFEALNRDFRYQLTVIGEFAQAIVLKKVDKNHFIIRTSKPGVEVSWQVTGIRQDAYANANRIPNEEDKPATEQGYYLHPEVFGQPAEKSIAAARPAGIPISGTN